MCSHSRAGRRRHWAARWSLQAPRNGCEFCADRLATDQEVGDSNPLTPTSLFNHLQEDTQQNPKWRERANLGG